MAASSLQHIRAGMEAERRRVDTEDRLAFRAMCADLPKEDEDVPGNVHIGPVNNAAPQGNQFAKYAGLGLLMASVGVPLAYLGGKYLDRPVSAPTEDKDTVVGLTILDE